MSRQAIEAAPEGHRPRRRGLAISKDRERPVRGRILRRSVDNRAMTRRERATRWFRDLDEWLTTMNEPAHCRRARMTRTTAVALPASRARSVPGGHALGVSTGIGDVRSACRSLGVFGDVGGMGVGRPRHSVRGSSTLGVGRRRSDRAADGPRAGLLRGVRGAGVSVWPAGASRSFARLTAAAILAIPRAGRRELPSASVDARRREGLALLERMARAPGTTSWPGRLRDRAITDSIGPDRWRRSSGPTRAADWAEAETRLT